VDAAGRVLALATLNDFLPGKPLPVEAVVMAGGYGIRLRPLTDDCPKPMLPVGGRRCWSARWSGYGTLAYGR